MPTTNLTSRGRDLPRCGYLDAGLVDLVPIAGDWMGGERDSGGLESIRDELHLHAVAVVAAALP